MATLLAAFPDEASCRHYIFYHRHRFAPRCPRCSRPATFRLTPYDQYFMSRCCSGFLSPTARTILHNTRIPLRTWFYALLLYSDLKTGLSQHSLRRLVGVSSKRAWAMIDRMRIHLALSDIETPLGGPDVPVYVDEARVWVGPSRQRCVVLGISDGKR